MAKQSHYLQSPWIYNFPAIAFAFSLHIIVMPIELFPIYTVCV